MPAIVAIHATPSVVLMLFKLSFRGCSTPLTNELRTGSMSGSRIFNLASGEREGQSVVVGSAIGRVQRFEITNVSLVWSLSAGRWVR